MKTVMLMRHGKSDRDDAELADFDRPLTERGRLDTERITHELIKRGLMPRRIISSTAKRAADTARKAERVFRETTEPIMQFERALYAAGALTILHMIESAPEQEDIVMLVGHNPGMQEAAEWLAGERLPEGMKTAAVACIDLDQDAWAEIDEGAGKLRWTLYPSDLRGG